MSVAFLLALALNPLSGDWIETLRNEKGDAVGMLVVPLGATEPRPLIVAVHGAEGRPDWMCGTTHDIVSAHPFVVCPHPDAQMTSMRSWASALQLRSAIERAVSAALHKYALYIDMRSPTYIGHSLGAMLAPSMLTIPGPTSFPNMLFYEGLPLDLAGATFALVQGGVQRVALFSGQSGWAARHTQWAHALRRKGIDAHHAHVDSGHFFGPRSIPSLRAEVQWLESADTSWVSALSVLPKH